MRFDTHHQQHDICKKKTHTHTHRVCIHKHALQYKSTVTATYNTYQYNKLHVLT